MTQFTAETLLTLGFRDVGYLEPTQAETGVVYKLDGVNEATNRAYIAAAKNSLYAFVIDKSVQYIGKTARTIPDRFQSYKHPHKGQKTNWRNSKRIRDSVAVEQEVRLFVFNPISQLRFGDFELNVAAGLEDSLIREFDPPWNGSADKPPITEEAERELAEVTPDQATEIPPVYTEGIASFQIKLGKTYYEDGVINPGVAASKHLGKNDDPINICFDDGTEAISSRIDRTANKSGGVRVVGKNRQIRDWFQKYFVPGEIVEAEVIDPYTILLHSKAPPK